MRNIYSCQHTKLAESVQQEGAVASKHGSKIQRGYVQTIVCLITRSASSLRLSLLLLYTSDPPPNYLKTRESVHLILLRLQHLYYGVYDILYLDKIINFLALAKMEKIGIVCVERFVETSHWGKSHCMALHCWCVFAPLVCRSV